MSKILDINYNHFHHLGRSQMCAGAWYVFRTSKPHSGTLCPGKTCSIRPDRVGMDPTRQDAELQVSRRDVATIVSEAGFPPQAASSHGWTSCGYSPVPLMNLSQCLQAEGGHGPGRGRVLYVANEAALYTALTITTNTRVLAVCKQTE